jgi:ribose transport system substrate-binding protein
MRGLLVRWPDLDAAFPINDPSAMGAIAAIEEAGRAGQVTVVTVDHLAGKPVTRNIVVPVKLITKENAASILK